MSKILIVDDALTDRALVGGLLSKSMDCTIYEAADGKEALSQIEEYQPDLVLTDLDMPLMNGMELVTAVKDENPLIPVILMTAKGSEDIASRALRRGAASYVPKRRLAEDLVSTVERVLNASRQNRIHTRLMHFLTQNECTFVLPNDLTLIQSVASYLLQVLRCLPLEDETERLRVGIALEEALSNAYYHGNLEIGSETDTFDDASLDKLSAQRCLVEPYRDRKIHIRANISREKAIFVIRDDGPGFSPEESIPTDEEIATHTSGRGLRLIYAIMDDVSFNDTGNEMRMVKRCLSVDADDRTED